MDSLGGEACVSFQDTQLLVSGEMVTIMVGDALLEVGQA